MRISDWSSDVCSSDLLCVRIGHHGSALFSSLTWPQEDTAIAAGYGGKCLDCRRCQRSDAFLAALRLVRQENDVARPKIDLTPIEAQCIARSEEHTSEIQSLLRISYAVVCLKKTKEHYT